MVKVSDEVVPSAMFKVIDLGFGKVDVRRFRKRDGTRHTQVQVHAVEDRYVLLVIQYMNICVHGAIIDGFYLV
jgi:hypothetical protein